MNAISRYSLPYKGLGIGLHKYTFLIEDDFFEEFEGSVIKKGKFDVLLTLDKRSDHCILNFEIDGYTPTSCDRCLADINLPVNGSYTLHIKFREDAYGEENDEIVFMNPDTSRLNVAQYLYEFISLSMPITKVFDCDPAIHCDTSVLEQLTSSEEVVEKKEEKTGGIWDELKKLDLKE